MDPQLRARVARLMNREPASWARVERGYTPAERWVIQFADGTSAFAKIGTTPLTADWLRSEHRCYSGICADFMARVLGWEDDPERPLLLLEDLSHACWPPPWEPDEVERLLATLKRMAATRPLPPDLASLETERTWLSGWSDVARDPGPFLSLGLCSTDWLARTLPTFLEAQNASVLEGDDLVHHDVRSDNVCLLPSRVVLIDWNVPRRGNAILDRAFFAQSLRLEGGPLPEEIAPDAGPMAGLVAGFFASRAGLPKIPDAPRVRHIQLRQLRIALPWAARTLGLPAPDLHWGRDALERIDSAYRAKKIDQRAWHAEIEEVIGDAYLASVDPRAQSGKSGDEEEWRWSRELALDALSRGGSLLDVGCANGYLMESFHRWGRERRIEVEPYGVDISWRMAALARRRLPHWAERIWVGNALDWKPPRRFDLVHTGIDYVPFDRQRDFVERLLRDVVKPGGSLVLRAERVTTDAPDLVAQIRALGLEARGVIERVHPTSGLLRRTVWLSNS
jgi:2-polyprenyl-3-methyl-5-hydroxy-6-metoxy-1,4-benzoquinol methylase